MNILELWSGMPEFKQEKKQPFKKIKVDFVDGSFVFVRFESEADYSTYLMKCHRFNFCKLTAQRGLFSNVVEQKITEKTKSIWFPFKSHWGGITEKYVSEIDIQNRYPVYIVSKGRHDKCITSRALSKMRVKHFVIVEAFEFDLYQESKTEHAEIIILDRSFQDSYDTCDDLGYTKSKGPGPARNYAKHHSMLSGHKKHWVMDDNIDAFHYLNRNEKLVVECPNTLAACEDFVDRFSNIPVSGMNYYSFCKKEDKVPPFILNTRIYSCLLIDNSFDYEWRGRYNEDTDLSLRVLKDGLCTIQFNAFLCGKVTTQRMRGGNSKEFYDEEGTLPKSKMIEDLHPDVAKVVWRFNRWHHHVNYSVFKENKLIQDKPAKNKDYKLLRVEK